MSSNWRKKAELCSNSPILSPENFRQRFKDKFCVEISIPNIYLDITTHKLVLYIDISNIISEETENLDEYSRNAFNIIQQVHLGHFFNTVWHSL